MDNRALMLESLAAADSLLIDAEKSIDLKCGEGYAAAHPELVGHFMLTAALNFYARNHANLMGYLATSLGRLSD